ncbi:MAG: hypothetical protein V4603_13765, partial [Pseudomonadota bacterium]
GRLIYQLVHPTKGLQKFTVILEFNLIDKNAQGVEAARHWHALGSSWHSFDTYVIRLKELVNSFATANRFERARTNESMQDDWQFRQFELATDKQELAPALLTKTLEDKFEGHPSPLDDYLAANKSSIENGEETFYMSPEWEGYEGIKSEIPSSLLPDQMLWSQETSEWFVIAFNTCNGCHHNNSEGERPQQIALFDVGKPAELSPFLTGRVELAFKLPDCPKQDMHGCELNEADGKLYWSELRNRADYLLYVALTPERSTLEKIFPGMFPKKQFGAPEDRLGRVH